MGWGAAVQCAHSIGSLSRPKLLFHTHKQRRLGSWWEEVGSVFKQRRVLGIKMGGSPSLVATEKSPYGYLISYVNNQQRDGRGPSPRLTPQL